MKYTDKLVNNTFLKRITLTVGSLPIVIGNALFVDTENMKLIEGMK